MKPALVILAAGASQRLGECKALVDLAGSTPLERLSRAGRCFDDGRVRVVTGAQHAAIVGRAPRGLGLLHNKEWRAGRTGGVALAQRELPGRDLVLAPVDCPLVPAEVFTALLAAWIDAGSPANGWLGPRYSGTLPQRLLAHGRFGHPVVLGRGLLEQLAGTTPDTPLNQLRALADPLLSVDVSALATLDDLDRPADLERIRRAAETGESA